MQDMGIPQEDYGILLLIFVSYKLIFAFIWIDNCSEKRSSLSYVIINPSCDLKLEEGDIV